MKWRAWAVSLVVLCIAFSGCRFEEARLRVANPLALCAVLRMDVCEILMASLITYPDKNASLLIISRGGGSSNWEGKIDMLGVKAGFSYPLRFDFVTSA